MGIYFWYLGFEQLIKTELKSPTSSFTVLNKISFSFIGSKIKEVENKSIRNKCIFKTVNSDIKLYGKLEKQIQKSFSVLEINQSSN